VVARQAIFRGVGEPVLASNLETPCRRQTTQNHPERSRYPQSPRRPVRRSVYRVPVVTDHRHTPPYSAATHTNHPRALDAVIHPGDRTGVERCTRSSVHHQTERHLRKWRTTDRHWRDGNVEHGIAAEAVLPGVCDPRTASKRDTPPPTCQTQHAVRSTAIAATESPAIRRLWCRSSSAVRQSANTFPAVPNQAVPSGSNGHGTDVVVARPSWVTYLSYLCSDRSISPRRPSRQPTRRRRGCGDVLDVIRVGVRCQPGCGGTVSDAQGTDGRCSEATHGRGGGTVDVAARSHLKSYIAVSWR